MYRHNYPDDPGMHSNVSHDYRHVTYYPRPSFAEQLRKSCFGVVVGLVLLGVAVVLLYYNEGRAVQTARSLEEGLFQVISVSAADVVNDYNQGKLIHVTGKLQASKVLYDSTYGLAVPAVRLKRHVEMYQWVEQSRTEEREEADGVRKETSYSYNTEWRHDLVNSNNFHNRFGHENPREKLVSDDEKMVNEVRVGAYYLSEALIYQISDFKKVTLSEENERPKNTLMLDSVIYYSHDPQRPSVGDLRLWFEYAGLAADCALGHTATVTAVGKQLAGTLGTFETEAGDDIEWLYEGDYTVQEVFSKQQQTNVILTWGLRGAGWLLLFLAFTSMTNIVVTLVSWFPVVREIITLGVAGINFSLAVSVWLTVIAISWLRFRPLFAAAILAAAAAPFILQKLRKRRSSSSM